jgi:hypothetical protein
MEEVADKVGVTDARGDAGSIVYDESLQGANPQKNNSIFEDELNRRKSERKLQEERDRQDP